jgi:hypothetical protein
VSRLAVVVPSRGRPGNMKRLWDAMCGTCRGDTRLTVGLDGDDETWGQYPLGPKYEVRSGLRFVVAWINELAVPRSQYCAAVGTIGDDNLPATRGWDLRIMKALEAAPFAFANDLYPREPGSLCCHIFMRSEVVRALGYMGPPRLRHMYVDVVWMAWGLATGIIYLDDVIIEHLHFTAGKAPADESYRLSTGLNPEDLQNYHAYCRDPQGLNEDIRKLGGRPYSPSELRKFNNRLFIPERI